MREMEFELDVPVVFITYIRLDTTKQVFEMIRKAKPKRLYHISDAANTPEKQERVQAVRNYVTENIDWSCELIQEYAIENYGCRKRINTGLDFVFEREDEAIILEDDVVPSLSFFRFCQEMLERYHDDSRVMMVTGNKRVPNYEMCGDYSFSKFCSIWGWATWARAWKQNDAMMNNWEAVKKEKIIEKFYGKMAAIKIIRETDMVYRGELNTWDYPWQISKACNGGLEIVPRVNLVKNVGVLSEDATHEATEDVVMEANELEFPIEFVSDVIVDERYDMELANSEYYASMFERAIRKIVPASWLRRIRKIAGR